MELKESELIDARGTMVAQIEDMQQRLDIKDKELQVKGTELQTAIADLAASKRLLESGVLQASLRGLMLRACCALWIARSDTAVF